MIIGLDFDNTIVSYDELFFKVAREQSVVPADTAPTKVAVRDYLRSIDRESVWTEMQGYVYGARMKEAAAYPGVLEFLRWARKADHVVTIVSHKTKHPFLGVQYDLHKAARGWVEQHLNPEGQPLISADRIFFELTKPEKLARISRLNCDVFLDDLPEILNADDFPLTTRPILFDPGNHHPEHSLPNGAVVHSWVDFASYVRQNDEH